MTERYQFASNTNQYITYRFTRVPFGITSSLFLLGATIKHHQGNGNGTDECNIHRDIYVDNLITGVNSKEEASRLYETSKSKLKEISMNLREWKSSSNDLNKLFQDDQMKGSKLKVLGLHWNTMSDKMAIPTEKFDKLMIATTKRKVLASIAPLFDPLEYLSPTTMKMRLFSQKLWNKEKDWNDTMDKEDTGKSRQIIEETKEVSTIEVPRYIGGKNSQLICFCDASKDAYATAIYLKTMDEERKSKVNLVFSKARIAPKKVMSIPRLKLMALFIEVRSLKFVSK